MDALLSLLPETLSAEQAAAIALVATLLQHVYSQIVQCMPKPFPSERWYGFLFAVAHTFAGNSGLVRDTLEKNRAAAEARFRSLAALDEADQSAGHPARLD